MVSSRHLEIRGRVQGVGFRYSLQQEARRLGLTGWVRNRPDGSVEAVIHGPSAAVEKLIGWARHGPPGARVTELKVNPHEASYTDFEQLPTG